MSRSDLEILERKLIRERLATMSHEELKKIMKESNKEWLDEKLGDVHRWTFRLVVGSIVVYILSLIVMAKS